MKTINVLLIEDNEIAQKIQLHILQQLGCAVSVAADGAIALELQSKNHYDVIFTDLGLPDMDGFELVVQIRKSSSANKDIPIIALTAHADEDYKNKADSVGMNGFIVKPLTPQNTAQILKLFVSQNKE